MCGKVVRFDGKISSGSAVLCVLPVGHGGECAEDEEFVLDLKDLGIEGEGSVEKNPERYWPFPTGNPKRG